MIEPTNHSTDASRDSVSWLSWLTRTALVVLALSIAAAQAPARVRLLGLFSVGVGCAMGAATAFLTRPHPRRIAGQWLLAMSVMASAGLAGSTWMAFRVEAAELARLEAAWRPKSSEQQFAENLVGKMSQESKGAIPAAQSGFTFEEFRWYLARRVRQLGPWPSPWPEVFWCAELLAGGAAAAWGFRFGVASSRKTAASEEASS